MDQREETSLTSEEIKEAAELFKLLLKWQQEAIKENDKLREMNDEKQKH